MNCENCEKEYEGKYGSGRFCSSKCARGFSTKAKRAEINKRVGVWAKINRPITLVEIECSTCRKIFKMPKTKSSYRYCSVECRKTGHSLNQSKIMKDLYSRGAIKRWNINGKPSFAEKFFMGVFDSREIKYDFNYKVGRYFIDFAFIDKMIGLEIDGKQHSREENIKHDYKRDAWLADLGWQMHRIKWRSLKSQSGKDYIKNEIDNFLAYLSS